MMFAKQLMMAVLLGLTVAAGLAHAQGVAVPRVQWRTGIPQAVEEARRQHKPLVVFLYQTDAAGRLNEYSAKQEQEVFGNPAFQALAERAIFARQDADQDDDQRTTATLIHELGVIHSPAVIVLDCRPAQPVPRGVTQAYIGPAAFMPRFLAALDRAWEPLTGSATEASLPNLLRRAGYIPLAQTTEGVTIQQTPIYHGGSNYSLAVTLSADKQTLWLSVGLGQLPEPRTLPSDQLVQLLQLDSKRSMARFAVTSTTLGAVYPIENRDVTETHLKGHIVRFMDFLAETSPRWSSVIDMAPVSSPVGLPAITRRSPFGSPDRR